MPSLWERTEDMPLLAHHFLKEFNRKSGMRLTLFPEAMQCCRLLFQGNVRELKNNVERVSMLSLGDLPADLYGWLSNQ